MEFNKKSKTELELDLLRQIQKSKTSQRKMAGTLGFSLGKLNYCLNELNISLEDLKTITANMPGEDYSLDILRNSLPKAISTKLKTIPSHHLSHAYTAYWPSGFDKAVVLSIDASGSTKNNQTESYSIYTAEKNNIELLHSESLSHL